VNRVLLGFKAFDAHELLCHFVAAEAGVYSRYGIRVRLVDITFIPDTELPAELFQVSCGAALAGALRGNGQRVVFVATDRPMFWLYGSQGVENLAALRHGRIAAFPAGTPPDRLTRLILQNADLTPDSDLELAPARDDMARLGLLKSGDVHGAVISSAMPPATLERAGFHRLCFFGDAIRLPTTGLAVHASQLQRRGPLVASLVGCLKESLALIRSDPGLVDITFIPDTELPAELFQVSCGAALAGALRGNGQRVVFVATDRPMFWLYGSQGVENLAALRHGRIAAFPAGTPPDRLTRLILQNADLTPDSDLELAPARDDMARLGLLKSGDVHGAVISSAMPPATLERAGFHRLCFFGDAIRLPTTGLAVHASQLQRRGPLVASLVGCLKESLALIRSDPGLVAQVLDRYFDVPGTAIEQTAKLYSDCFTGDGRTTPAIAQAAVDSLSASLGIDAPVPWKRIYDFSP